MISIRHDVENVFKGDPRPVSRHLEWGLYLINSALVRHFDFAFGSKFALLLKRQFDERSCGSLLRVLWDKEALDGELENGLAELRNRVRCLVKKVKVIPQAAPVGSEGLRLTRSQQVIERGVLESRARVVPRLLPRLKLIAQYHQLIHLDHNSPLLG